jgi:hypothetical protein
MQFQQPLSEAGAVSVSNYPVEVQSRKFPRISEANIFVECIWESYSKIGLLGQSVVGGYQCTPISYVGNLCWSIPNINDYQSEHQGHISQYLTLKPYVFNADARTVRGIEFRARESDLFVGETRHIASFFPQFLGGIGKTAIKECNGDRSRQGKHPQDNFYRVLWGRVVIAALSMILLDRLALYGRKITAVVVGGSGMGLLWLTCFPGTWNWWV